MTSQSKEVSADMLKLKILTWAVCSLAGVWIPTTYFVWDISATLTQLQVQASTQIRDTDRLVTVTEKLVDSLSKTREELVDTRASAASVSRLSETLIMQSYTLEELERRIDKLEGKP
jgi:hypothetical protein